ncbi:MAG: GNAT family N-acetyltransferase [Tannerella sp.]|jgi:ribosomal protein S18 acetylase RimI-like enzyme|nr:GNAT family N-acetyltransferase [Tannerella sp.]
MNNADSFYIEKMQVPELEEVALILTDAFETNPAYASIFHKTDLREGLGWLFRTSLFLLNRHEILTRVVKEKQTGMIVGTYTIVPPEGVKRTFGDYLKVGLPAFIYRFGFSALIRMLRLDSYNKDVLTKSIQSEVYYYLSMVVVKEDCRGKGVGSFAIRTCLNELHQTKHDCRILGLTTQLPQNVSFYSNLGFELIDEGEIHFNKTSYYNYNMKRLIQSR